MISSLFPSSRRRASTLAHRRCASSGSETPAQSCILPDVSDCTYYRTGTYYALLSVLVLLFVTIIMQSIEVCCYNWYYFVDFLNSVSSPSTLLFGSPYQPEKQRLSLWHHSNRGSHSGTIQTEALTLASFKQRLDQLYDLGLL